MYARARTHTHTHTHESTSDTEGLRDFLQDMSDAVSVPDFLQDSTKVHAWTYGSEIGGRAGHGVYFPHDEYDNISEPVVGPQTSNKAEVSVVSAGTRAVRNTEELCLYSDSKWCVDSFNNLQLYKRRAWMAQAKKPVRHQDVWEEIFQLLQGRKAPMKVSMIHVYGHNITTLHITCARLGQQGPRYIGHHSPEGQQRENRGRGGRST